MSTHFTRIARPLAALALAVAAGVGGLLPVVPAQAAPLSSDVLVQGHGWGHGRGMGQYGSLGYAIEQGWTYRQIVDHFYSNTTHVTLPDAANIEVTVRLMRQDDRDRLIVRSGSAFTVGGTAFVANTAARILHQSTTGAFLVQRSATCTESDAAWTTVATITGTDVVEAVPVTMRPGEDLSKMLELCKGTDTRHYRGALRLHTTSFGYRTVNRVLLEEYLRGVVPRESPSSWGSLGSGKGVEALKAQAIAARSYAYSEGRYAYAKTCDTPSCQVYDGAAFNGSPLDHGSAYASSSAAVAATAGEVRMKSTAVARAEFSSSTGGYTARMDLDGNGFPDVPDAGDTISKNPNHLWSTSISRAAIQARYPEIGSLVTISVTQRNDRGDWGGRVKKLVLRGTSASKTLTGDQFRLAFGLKSDWFRFANLFDHPVVSIAASPTAGYWLGDDHGGVFNLGGTTYYGDASSTALNQPAVDLAVPRTGSGYWVLAGDGGVFTFGGLAFYGSTGNLRLNKPVVGMAAHPSGQGYWFVATDGGVFTYGPKARFFGSMGAVRLNKPVVGMAGHPSGDGYWLVAADGGIFTFGAAKFFGSTGDLSLVKPIVAMAAHPSGKGYWFVASDGGVFSMGAAKFHGSLGADPPAVAVTDIAATPSGNGYWIIDANGGVYAFGDAT